MADTNFTGNIQGYKIGKPIGQGKFATVFKAESPTGKMVALKKIKIFDMQDAKQREKCLKEVKLMQPLDHPNIIKYLDSFIFNNELIIVAEWAEKGDLKRLIRIHKEDETPFEELKIWEFMGQIAAALMHMHEKRIMHRDLKPANIFIATDGSLKIGDLGLGRVFSSETIEAYSKVGTPLYMSPELLHGEGYDQKSDIWSLGCVAYELCEFKSPFRNENEKMSLMNLFENITKGDFAPINKQRHSEELQKIISQMIVIKPQDRVDAEYVYKKSQTIIEQLKKSPKIDCILVNEDIYEKLGLIEYHKYFCKPMNKKPVSKVYFAVNEGAQNPSDKFFYFSELCYWIMSIPKYDKNKIQAHKNIKVHMNYDTVDECGKKLLMDIKQWGIRIPNQINIAHIRNGYGDTVCFILNDLLNRELIRLNFQFEQPQVKTNKDLDQQEDWKDNDDDEKYLIGSDQEKNINDMMEEDQEMEYSIQQHELDNMLQQEQDEDKKFIHSSVDPLQWKKEVLRVEKDLKQIQTTYNKIGDSDYHIMMDKLKSSGYTIHEGMKQIQEKQNLNKLINIWTDDLQRINRGEQRINQSNLELIDDLKVKVDAKKVILQKLTDVSDVVNANVELLDKLNQKWDDKQQAVCGITNDSESGTSKVNLIKNAIDKIKGEILSMDQKIGIVNAQILKYALQHKQQYDGLSKQQIMENISSLTKRSGYDDEYVYEDELEQI